MKLIVTNNDEDYGLSCYKLTFDQLKMSEFHPMVATTKWDEVTIEVNNDTPKGIISQMSIDCPINVVVDLENVTVSMLQVLMELYPDHAAKLRATFMSNKETFSKLLKELVERK